MTSVHQTELPLDAAASSSRSTTGYSVDRHWESTAVNPTAQPAAPQLCPDSADGGTRPVARGAMLLTVRDVEAELQLGRTRTYELLRSGEIPVIRIGRVLRGAARCLTPLDRYKVPDEPDALGRRAQPSPRARSSAVARGRPLMYQVHGGTPPSHVLPTPGPARH